LQRIHVLEDGNLLLRLGWGEVEVGQRRKLLVEGRKQRLDLIVLGFERLLLCIPPAGLGFILLRINIAEAGFAFLVVQVHLGARLERLPTRTGSTCERRQGRR
jgi:hypothetical protein